MEPTQATVEVWVEGGLRKFVARPMPITLPAGQTVRELIAALGIQTPQPVVALVNGQAVDLNHFLDPGDTLKILPLISGG